MWNFIVKKLTDEELKKKRPGTDELRLIERFSIAVIAENIRSLYNVGSIFRTSDGALIEKLFLCGYTGFPPRKEITKTALGSEDTVPWERCQDTPGVIRNLKSRGYYIVALEHTDSGSNYFETEYRFPMCLVLGNEVDGILPETLALCDSAVEIPMYGKKQSLNVSVAYGIVVYHLVNEYNKKYLT
jgi:tRNA G18 (ribose-2'-O)-methylase SpoU